MLPTRTARAVKVKVVEEISSWLLLISNFVVPDSLRGYARGGCLSPPPLDELREAVRQAAYDESSVLLARLAMMTDEDIIAIRNAALEAARAEMVLCLPDTLYFYDPESDSSVGARVRRASMKAMETQYANWRDRETASNSGDAG